MSIKKNNTYFKENDGKVYYYDENGVPSAVPNSAFGTLKDELENTSAELAYTIETTSGILHGEIETASGNLQEQIDNLGSPLTYSGTKTVDEINALENIKQGTVYTMSNSGTITAGDIEVEQSDEIAYADGWVKIGKDLLYSDYYKKTETSGKEEIQDALDLKQNNLIAGTDIVINNGEIGVNTNGSAIGDFAFVEGQNTFAGGLCDHVEGMGGIADNGGMNHIEGFQYHSYCSNGPATNFNNTNIVKFPNVCPVILRNNDRISPNGTLYELVKIFKDRFIVSCDYGGGDGAGIYHYTQNPFYNPELYKIIDVDLDSSTNEILITIDGIINVPGSSNGFIQLYGPTTINSINGTGGSLSSGQTLNTFIFNGGLGFPGNCLDNVRLDNTFISINLGYTKTGEQEQTTISKIIEIKNIEFDSSNNSFTFTTEDIEIPDIVGGGYTLALYVINSTYNGCNHIEGQDNSIHYGCNSHAEGFCNTITNNCSHVEGSFNYASNPNSHAEGNSTSACGSCSHTEGKKTFVYTNASNSHAEGYQTKVSGQAAHAEGSATIASGNASHAEGYNTIAVRNYAHAEGSATIASGIASHTEGGSTFASGQYAHAEGYSTYANGQRSHAEGNQTSAYETAAHSEGTRTKALGLHSHSEGNYTSAHGFASHAEGNNTSAVGDESHAEGQDVIARGTRSHAEGGGTFAYGENSHTEGYYTTAIGEASHAEGKNTLAYGSCSHAEGQVTQATGYASHAEGYGTSAFGEYTHTEGASNLASGNYSHAEGISTTAGAHSHAEGYHTLATNYSHTEGYSAQATNYSHAEGQNTLAKGSNSHAEGYATSAVNNQDHTEGSNTYASGGQSHAEGYSTKAFGFASHAEGQGTIADDTAMHAGGNYNKTSANALFVIGNGTDDEHRSDAFIVSADGTVSAKRFIEADPALTITGGDFVTVTENQQNNLLTIDLETSLGQMITELSGVLTAKPSTGRHILGVDNGTLIWLEVNQ